MRKSKKELIRIGRRVAITTAIEMRHGCDPVFSCYAQDIILKINLGCLFGFGLSLDELIEVNQYE